MPSTDSPVATIADPRSEVADLWHYTADGERKGRCSTEELLQRVEKGEVAPSDLVWRAGMSEWQPISKTELMAALSATAPQRSESAVLWEYIQQGNWCEAPATAEDLRCMVKRGDLLPHDMVRRLGTERWCPICDSEIEAPGGPASSTAAQEEPADSIHQWHYAKDGRRLGPVTLAEVRALLDRGVLDREDLVWTKGMPQWKKLGEAKAFSADGPPPLTGSGVNNAVVWITPFVPIAHALMTQTVGGREVPWAPLAITVFVNTFLCSVDLLTLKRAGHRSSRLAGWAVLVVPVYLWKRSRATGQAPSYFIVWCIVFVLSLLL